MAQTLENSTEYAAEITTPPTIVDAVLAGGKLRVKKFTFTQGAAAGDATSTMTLVKIPAGKVALIGGLSRIEFSAFGASRVLDIGWAAYKDKLGAAVAASAAGLDNDVDVSSAGSSDFGGAIAGSIKTFESQNGVTLFATVAGGTIPIAATLTGYVVYSIE